MTRIYDYDGEEGCSDCQLSRAYVEDLQLKVEELESKFEISEARNKKLLARAELAEHNCRQFEKIANDARAAKNVAEQKLKARPRPPPIPEPPMQTAEDLLKGLGMATHMVPGSNIICDYVAPLGARCRKCGGSA